MNRLRKARECIGLTVDEVAAYMGWLPEWVERAEAAEVAPMIYCPDEWERLSKVLGRPVAWLRGGLDPLTVVPPEVHDMFQGRLLSNGDRGAMVDETLFLRNRSETRH